ncbi:epoxide hydrolase family protein [Bradyrhizobium sp. JYMT SZCCT0428]|uniref:epoxide hydrolase family protein n=1 Tax=Bradyrhizobium sp. JYMT SZCCT0428 TaxID=2807673 RepID=UPI001BAB923D|nr:epoxide hydrolase family protein [Bradyrhizobium sp. JYMT SZCCT0428]MBR1152764.1 epoxide hydrolase [Bradyrhizobium sp. JYMT SZCCT0428]
MSAEIKPYRISVGDDVLDDLKSRLRNTRWPEAELVDDWSQGAPLKWIKDICRYWADEYDWRAREARLNRFTQFTTEIDGLDIHFLHVRSPHPQAMPLIITHGWPGSVVEFHNVIEPLTNPTAYGGNAADAFHVVCPSLPGFGFSAKPATTGWGVDRIASAWAVLMDRLGYARYGAQGGDWGSAVTTALGAQDGEHCAGIHITLAMSAPPNVDGQPTPEEARALQGIKYYADWDSGYSKQQSTRPQTLGYGLTDSPSGQAAWILEKFWAWTDCDGHPENILGRDELLDNVMLYWVTATAASSARLYWESFGPKRRTPHKVTIPCGVAVFPKEIVTPVRRWMDGSYTDIRHWRELPKGGHFAAFEQPELFVGEVRDFFRTLRQPVAR